ncbi:MAG: ribulokinase [Anaerolineales bacterium]|nr:ribulokinase [Anaerolineales bacterium]
MTTYSLGLDFGTESARTILVNNETGDILAVAVHSYGDGVIDEGLPGSSVLLPPDWALQNPSDWMAAIEICIPKVIAESGVDPETIVGVGVDFTACTVLPCRADGTPLCLLDSFRDKPHAWAKLWKHHAAQPQADRINELAATRDEYWLARYGGTISSEWLLPKALEILENAPEVYSAADYIVEGADWVVWQLTGQLSRNTCTAGYKAAWNKKSGYPDRDFLLALHRDLGDLTEKIAGPIIPPGDLAGRLAPNITARLGLPAGIPVAAAIIDAHSAALGGGVSSPGTLFMIMGTSTCHMLLSDREVLVEGISGVVEDGIVPGFFGYEAGQASVGDIFGWFVEHGAPAEVHQIAIREYKSIHEILTDQASRLKPGQSGLIALDWWNGCRTPLVDGDLSGALFGYSLQTTPAEIYRALIESTAYGTRLISELFRDGGVKVDKLKAGGGLTKNHLLLQIYADVIGMPVEVDSSQYASAQGAAMLGAVAGGVYSTLVDAIEVMAPPPSRVIYPDAGHKSIYDSLYQEYVRLVNLFGRDRNSPLKRLRSIKLDAYR